MKTLIRQIMAVFFLALGAGAWAGFQEGIDAYDRGDYQAALKEFKLLNSDKRAQFLLGVM